MQLQQVPIEIRRSELIRNKNFVSRIPSTAKNNFMKEHIVKLANKGHLVFFRGE
jgi:hypothetical protein